MHDQRGVIMLKKLCFFTIFMSMFCTMANAAVDKRTECVGKGYGFFWKHDDGERIAADYAIYFDNAKTDIPSDCRGEVNSLVDKLKTNKDNIESIILVGMADTSGNANQNAKLGEDRANTVAELLKNAGLPSCTNESKDKRCARFSGGDSLQRAKSDISSNKWARAVFVWVIKKEAQCTQDKMDTIDNLISVFDKKLSATPNDEKLTTAKEKLTHAKGICGDVGNSLQMTESAEIDEAIYYAITNYPELRDLVPSQIIISSQISGLITKLTKTREDMSHNASVWKSADGSFNTTRLASDSIAGVVLGTTGALVTSHIVKKNQLKSGFEGISCTIGGQEVATYGDEFTVGIR